MTHCVRCGSLTPTGKGHLGIKPRRQSMQLEIAAATWQTERKHFSNTDQYFSYFRPMLLSRLLCGPSIIGSLL